MTEMAFEDLEKIHDLLAEKLDAVGEEKHALFLAKLVMLLAQRIGDPEIVREAIGNAGRGVVEPT